MYIWWIILGVFIVANTVYESLQQEKIFKLNLQIEEMTKYFDETKYKGMIKIDETIPRNVQIMQLQHQADVLKFCFLCPLYQEKVLKDTQQNLLQE